MNVGRFSRERTVRNSPVVVILIVLACFGSSLRRETASTPISDWVLVWHDEFNGPLGSAPDPTKWVLETGGSGWGNNELEYYTARRQNVRQEGGNLLIEAMREKYIGRDGIRRNYTSARLKSQGRFSQKYGRFEARIRVPSGKGLWSAFWLLGDDISTTG